MINDQIKTCCLLLMGLASLPIHAQGNPANSALCTKENVLDMSKFDAADEYLRKTKDNHTHSFTVHFCGKKVYERFYPISKASPGAGNIYTAEDVHEIQSATKTVMSLLIGAAMYRGDIPADVHTPLFKLLPAKYKPLFVDGRENITLHHVLSMTTGIHWVDPQDGGNSFDRLEASEDTVMFMLQEQLEHEPGKVFKYNTGNTHLLSAILYYNRPPNKTQYEYIESLLLNKLNIEMDWSVTQDNLPTQPAPKKNYWLSTKDNMVRGGWDSHYKISDFYKFGELLLNRGNWRGEQIISPHFVDEMTKNQIPAGQFQYGYQMWIPYHYGIDDVAAQSGFGGQENIILNDYQMYVTFTGDIEPFPMAPPYNDYQGAWMRQIRDISKVMKDFVAHSVTPSENKKESKR